MTYPAELEAYLLLLQYFAYERNKGSGKTTHANAIRTKIFCAGQYGIFFSFVNIMNVTHFVPFLVPIELISPDYRIYIIFVHLLYVVKI